MVNLLESIKDHAIIQTDLEGQVIYWNAGAEKILGWAKQEMFGQTADIIFTEEDRSSNVPVKERDRARETGKAEDNRWHLRQDGSKFYATGILHPTYDRDELTGYVKVLRDASIFKKNEDITKETLALFHTVAETVPSIIWTATADVQIQFFNKRWTEYTGLSFEESLVSGYEKVVRSEDLAMNLAGYIEGVRTGKPVRQEQRLRRFDGEYRWHLTEAVPVRNEHGEVIQWVGCTTDIHDHKILSEKLLLESKIAERTRDEIYQSFMQAPVALVILMGPEHRFTMANPLYENIIGRKVKGKTVKEAFTEIEVGTFIPLLDKVYETGETYVGKEQVMAIRDESGEFKNHWLNFAYAPLRDTPNGKVIGIIAIVQDVTESVLARKEVESYIQDLKIEKDLRERFVSTLSHDLRTPLTAAKLGAQILTKKAHDPEAIQKVAGRIVQNMDRADGMIRDLLDANKIRAGEKIRIKISEVNVCLLAQETIDDLGSIYGDRFVLISQESLIAHVSPEGIRRVLENLDSNAIKYGSLDKVTFTLVKDGDFFQIKVHNFGTPINPQDLKTLFQPFTRTTSAQAGIELGWGLGLTLVSGISEAHGGYASVESDEIKGTTFCCHIPLDARKFAEAK